MVTIIFHTPLYEIVKKTLRYLNTAGSTEETKAYPCTWYLHNKRFFPVILYIFIYFLKPPKHTGFIHLPGLTSVIIFKEHLVVILSIVQYMNFLGLF